MTEGADHLTLVSEARLHDLIKHERERFALQDVLTKWLKAYDQTGPDNGPSLVEHDCADEARALLEKIRA